MPDSSHSHVPMSRCGNAKQRHDSCRAVRRKRYTCEPVEPSLPTKKGTVQSAAGASPPQRKQPDQSKLRVFRRNKLNHARRSKLSAQKKKGTQNHTDSMEEMDQESNHHHITACSRPSCTHAKCIGRSLKRNQNAERYQAQLHVHNATFRPAIHSATSAKFIET